MCSLVFFSRGPGISVVGTRTDDMARLADNLAAEMPVALNLGINATDPVGTLRNFTLFSAAAASGRRMNLTAFWLVLDHGEGGLNVTVFNYMGAPYDFLMDVYWGAGSSDSDSLHAAHGALNSTVFSVTGAGYGINLTAAGEAYTFETASNRTGLYGTLRLSRDGEVVSKEILA